MADITNKKVKALPYDENGRGLSGLVFPLVDAGGNVVGWAPVSTVDRGDGTVSLRVKSDISIESADIDIGDIHLLNIDDEKINPATEDTQALIYAVLNGQLKIASSDGQVSGNKFIRVDDSGRLLITAAGSVCSGNSTTTPLAAGATFTGIAEASLPISHIVISVRSDQPSASGGLTIEISGDGINWHEFESFTVPASKLKVYTFGPAGSYFRIKYTNGSVDQSEFLLQTTIKPFYQKSSTHVISNPITDEDDAELVKAVITAQSDSGTFLNIKASDDGFLRVVAPTPEAPPGTTPVRVVVQGSVSTPINTYIPITSGKTLTLQLFSAGSQDTTGGSKVEIFEDPNGDLSLLNLVEALYVNGASDSVVLGDKFIGNGTRRLVLRRSGLSSSSAREIFAALRGFES